MIEQITIENFKSLRKVNLHLGKLNIFIGTNASGKSNFFDALRVLQGIGYGFTLHEILDGKPKGASSDVWEGIRGGSQRAKSSSAESDELIRFRIGGCVKDSFESVSWDYTIAFSAPKIQLREESLSINGVTIFDSSPIKNRVSDPVFQVRYYHGEQGRPLHLQYEKTRSVLSQLSASTSGYEIKLHIDLAHKILKTLADLQRIDPSPALLRSYSYAHEIKRMGEHGENFAALVKAICSNPRAKEDFVSWLKELRPQEIEDVGTISGAVGEPLFMLKEGGREYPAPVLSDGTLRFAAITAAFFQPEMPGLLTIEEIENGIHANRLRLLVELLRTRSAEGQTQLLATSHSPIILAWLNRQEYATTFFCKRDESGESQIRPLTEIPDFNDVIKKQPISDLFSEGWLEAAL